LGHKTIHIWICIKTLGVTQFSPYFTSMWGGESEEAHPTF